MADWSFNGYINVTILGYSMHYIHAKIMLGTNMQWLFIGICGQPEVSIRRETWNLIQSLHAEDMGPRLLGGDFNELVSNEEK